MVAFLFSSILVFTIDFLVYLCFSARKQRSVCVLLRYLAGFVAVVTGARL